MPPPPVCAPLNSPQEAIQIRPGTDCDLPLRAALPETSIAFCHPGYEAPFNTLFSLPRIESASGEQGPWGVHYLTALTACQIIANNAFDGYLAEQAGGPRIAADNDSILTRDQYFFIVPEIPTYAIVPSFQEWQFPGSVRIPQAWRDAAATTTRAGDTRVDGRCVVSGRFTVELAHLSPKEDKVWFLNNAMALYDPHSASSPSDCPSNRLQIDCSLYASLDRRLWAFAPRHGRFAVQAISLPETLTYHMLSEFVHEYHGRHMRMHQTRVEFLFARFAWAVLYLVKGFVLMARPKTRLARYRVWDDGVPRVKEQGLPAKDIDVLFGGGGTRSASPRKRSRTSSDHSRGSGRECAEGWDWGASPDWNGPTTASPRKRRRTLSDSQDRGSDCELGDVAYREWDWGVCPDWNITWREPTAFEERGRKRTRVEDAVKHGKRRIHTRGVSVPESVSSLAESGSAVGKTEERES